VPVSPHSQSSELDVAGFGTRLTTFSEAVALKFPAAVYTFRQHCLAFPVEKSTPVEVIVEPAKTRPIDYACLWSLLL